MKEPTIAQRTAALLRGVDILAIPHIVRPSQWLTPNHESYDYDDIFKQQKITIYRCWALTDNGKRVVRSDIADHFSGAIWSIKEAWQSVNATCDVQENQDAEDLP